MKDAIWLIAAVIALGVGAVAGHDAEQLADQQDAEALASRDYAARDVCKGQPFTWEDDMTLVCHREKRP